MCIRDSSYLRVLDHTFSYFLILSHTLSNFIILSRSFSYLLLLSHNFWYFPLLSPTSLYFLILYHTFSYFSILYHTCSYFLKLFQSAFWRYFEARQTLHKSWFALHVLLSLGGSAIFTNSSRQMRARDTLRPSRSSQHIGIAITSSEILQFTVWPSEFHREL